MPERYRNVLVMTFFAGQTSQQIADQLSVSKGAVDGRIRRARHLLRVRLARRGVEFGAVAVVASLTTRHAAAASPRLIRDTRRMAQLRDGETVSPAVDLARLNSLIPLETNLMNAGLLATVLTCLTFAAGAVGLRLGLPATIQVAEDETPANDSVPLNAPLPDAVLPIGPNDLPTTKVPRTLSAQTGEDARTLDTVAARGEVPPATPSQYAEFTSEHARNAEAEIRRGLNGTVPPLDFPGEVSLSEVLELLSEQLQIRFVPDYAELNTEGTLSLEDVTIRNIVLRDVSLRSALDLILSQTRDPQLEYVICNEVVLITTREAAESIEYRMLRCYDVAELMKFAERHSALFATDSPVFEAQTEDHGQASGQGFFSVAGQSSSETRPGAAGTTGTAGTAAAAFSMPDAHSPMPDAHSSAKILISVIRSMGPHALPARVTPIQMAIIGPVLMVRGSRRDHEQIVEVLELLEASVRHTGGTR